MLNDSSVVGGASWTGLAARATHRYTPYLLLYRREENLGEGMNRVAPVAWQGVNIGLILPCNAS